MRQEFAGRRIEQWSPRAFATTGGADPASLHKHVDCALRNLDTADRLDFGAADRLVIGDDRQRFGCCTGESARFLAGSAKQMREIWRSLKMPAAAALDKFDAPAAVMVCE